MNYAWDLCCPSWNVFSPCLSFLLNLCHSISFSRHISASPFQYLSVSFTCSLSCYILASLWGWRSQIRHVIRGEMWESGWGKLGVAMGWCYWPSTPPHWPRHDTREQPALHPRFIFFMAGCQCCPPPPQHQTHSSSWWGVTKDNLLYLLENIPAQPQGAASDIQQKNPHREDTESEVKGVHRFFRFIFYCRRERKSELAS